MGAARFERYCDDVNETILRDEVDKSNLKKRFVEQQVKNVSTQIVTLTLTLTLSFIRV